MVLETLVIRANSQLFKLNRGMLQTAKEFYILLILTCSLDCVARGGPCPIDGLMKLVDYDACMSYKDNYNAGFKDVYASDFSPNHVSGNAEIHSSVENVCSNSESFCFPSTLSGFFSEHNMKEVGLDVAVSVSETTSGRQLTGLGGNTSLSSDHGVFQFPDGRTVSCSLCYRDVSYDMSLLYVSNVGQSLPSCIRHLVYPQDTNSSAGNSVEIKKSQFTDGSSPHVKISPPQLDWGENYLYSTSPAFLTVKNTCNESVLNVYEPFSTNTQFYPCNFSELSLGPGEAASICFIFAPRWLGMSSAQIILQTSSGGFLLQAKGLAVDSPYNIRPLVEFDVLSSGWWSRNLSLFNPFDETVHVEEVTAWISIFAENASLLAEANCGKEDSHGSEGLRFSDAKTWLDVRSTAVYSPLIAVRPFSHWVIGSGRTETIMGVSFLPDMGAKVLGTVCIQLHRPLQAKTDILMVPLEAELKGKEPYRSETGFASASVEAIRVCDSGEAVVSVSIRNSASYLLRIIEISEVAETRKLLQIKYLEGLLLFPGTVTQVALVKYRLMNVEYDSLFDNPNKNMNCKLKILINDSSSPQIDIPCLDIIQACPRNERVSSVGYEQQPENSETGHGGTGSLSCWKISSTLTKGLEKAEADEFVLQNWRSQGTISDLSVLDAHEVVFSMVPVGKHHSQFITVKNPSQEPIVVQLILNSGEIVNGCKIPDGYLLPPSSSSFLQNDSARPTRYGFSIAEGALTEVYIHPFGIASLGPILFHPSSRCGWKSSALIRNNLSGVEWLSLQGFGGLLSLVLLEGSQPVQRIEFNLNMPAFNSSSPDIVLNVEDAIHGCHKPLAKQLFASNTGDLPVTVKRIDVSGTECGLDGFIVHNCKGFTLEPGESRELWLSYRTDFSVPTVQRDLELTLATGILVIPMKASMPIWMLNLCHNSMFWVRLKRYWVVIFLAASLIFTIICFLLPYVMAHGSLDYLMRGESCIATARTAMKSSRGHCERNGNLNLSTQVSSLLSSVGQDEVSVMGSVVRYSDNCRLPKHDIIGEHVNDLMASLRETNTGSNVLKETGFETSLQLKSVKIDGSDKMDASQPSLDKTEPSKPVNLTVRTGKDKGRRRRNRKGAGVGLSGLEVSSSQSGNSTPSSPLSPVTVFTPKHLSPQPPDKERSNKSWSPFSCVTERQCDKVQDIEPGPRRHPLSSDASVKVSSGDSSFSTSGQPSGPGKMASRVMLLPSATFPCMGRSGPSILSSSPRLASRSVVAPQARAPGSKLCGEKTVPSEEVVGSEDKFKYDIWGKHFSGLHLKGGLDDASFMGSVAHESESNSFFVMSPQTLMTNSGPRSVSGVHQEG
ncbi:hypothetical protein Ancab_026015 [Ancistrocladus abbreviatus]